MDVEFIIENRPEIVVWLNKTVHERHLELYPDIFKAFNYDKFLASYNRLLKRENVLTIMIKNKKEYIGYALLVHTKTKSTNPFVKKEFELLYIDQMSIEEAYQNKGIGVKLFAFIKYICKERGISRIQLDVWKNNDQAKYFYSKIGFETIREVMEYKLDEESV